MIYSRLAILLLMVMTCVGMGSKQPPKPTKPPVEVVLTPAQAQVKINIIKLTGFNPAQEARYRKVIARTELIINSAEFKIAVSNFLHKGKAQFFDTLDSNQNVLSKVLSKDWDLEYRLEYMRVGSSTIGYTYPDVQWIALNARKYAGLSDKDLSANLCHEMGGHKIGRYEHSSKYNSNRPFSVPYGLGSICSDLF